MTNLYSGRSMNEIMSTCVLDLQFFKNTLRNYRPGLVGDLGTYMATDDTPKQSVALGLPAVCIDGLEQLFPFPGGLGTYMATDGDWAVEYFGVPQNRGLNAAVSNAYWALMGRFGAATSYIAFKDGGLFEVNFGTVQTATAATTWWWYDNPVHLVLSRGSGANPDTYMYVNGVRVEFASGTYKAGAAGFPGLCHVFNHLDDQGDYHPLWGHHHMLRVYSYEIAEVEALELFKDVQRIVPQRKFMIPRLD